jgi:hypothetical protein
VFIDETATSTKHGAAQRSLPARGAVGRIGSAWTLENRSEAANPQRSSVRGDVESVTAAFAGLFHAFRQHCGGSAARSSGLARSDAILPREWGVVVPGKGVLRASCAVPGRAAPRRGGSRRIQFRRLAEALEQQTATADILRSISNSGLSSPFVFGNCAIVEL